MTQEELQTLWSKTLRAERPAPDQFDRLAQAVVDVYEGGDLGFQQHIRNRYKRVEEITGQRLDPDKFDISMARAFLADEIGFASWSELIQFVANPRDDDYPVLFKCAIAALWRGDFTALEIAVGGPGEFDAIVASWVESGYLHREPKTMAESFAAACMLGHERAAAMLLDAGVDPYAGMRTGLAGFHYAASSGRLNVIRLLIERKVPMEVKNMYGGTVFEQAIWSAVNEYTPDHAAIVEALVEAGAVIGDGYDEWWDKQNVPDSATKERIAIVLRRHAEFHDKVSRAKEEVAVAENRGQDRSLADALKALGNVLRRPPFLRGAANEAYAKAAELYRKLGLPLEEAWVKRHIGINHEYAEHLTDAEKFYDESLALFRVHASDNDNNYANTVRYPAVIKNRVGKRDESTALWEEAVRRYDEMGQPLGVAEGAAWLTIFAIEKGDSALAHEWFAKAEAAAKTANDPDTDKWIAEVRTRLDVRVD
jgi:tetratricopeptide (TPR) repeat protein